MKLKKEIEGGKEFIEVDMPVVLGCQEPIAEWKIPNMRGIMTARTKPLKVLEAVSADGVSETVSFENLPAKGSIKMIEADKAEDLIDLLKNEAKVL